MGVWQQGRLAVGRSITLTVFAFKWGVFYRMGFPSADAKNYTLEYSYQHMPGSLLTRSQKKVVFPTRIK
jgi:hypothetical protein